MAGSKLTPKRARFCEEYLVDLNAAGAAVRAGFAAKSAKVTGSQLLANPNVAAEIARLQAERSKRTEVTADEVIGRWARTARASMADYLDGDQLKPLSQLTPDQLACIEEITYRDRRRVIKLRDRDKADEMIARHLGMLVNRHSGPDGKGPIALSVESESTVFYYPHNGRDDPGDDEGDA